MPKRPDLSVIVVTHNRTELALATLRSAMAASGPIDVEWLVFDCASTEPTAQRIAEAFPQARLLRGENVGFAAASNRALAHARGRFLLLLNPDVTIERGTLAEIVGHLELRPRLGAASVIQRSPAGALQWSIRRFPTPGRVLAEALGCSRVTALQGLGEEQRDPVAYGREGTIDWAVGAFLMLRAEALAAVGGLDERFFMYSEETDLCLRLHRAGWEVAHLPMMTITHHTGGPGVPALAAQLSYAKLLFGRKHLGARHALALRAALVLRHALRALVFSPLALSGARRWQGRALCERSALAAVLRADVGALAEQRLQASSAAAGGRR